MSGPKRSTKWLFGACLTVMALLAGMTQAALGEAAAKPEGNALEQAALVGLVSDEVADSCREVYAAKTQQGVDAVVARYYAAYLSWARHYDSLYDRDDYTLSAKAYAELKASRRSARILLNLYKVIHRAIELCAEKQRQVLAGGGGATPGSGFGVALKPIGRLAGSCTGLAGQSPTASFELLISSGGTLGGQFGGDRLRGTVNGRLDSRGLVQANGVAEARSAFDAPAARCQNIAVSWTGLIERQAGGALSGGGKWSGTGSLSGGAGQGGRGYTSDAVPQQCQCSGTWHIE